MPEKNPETISWITLLLAMGFGIWGGAAKYLHEVSQDTRRFKWAGLISWSFVAGFCGVLLGMAALHYELDIYLTLFIAGASGWLGPKTLAMAIGHFQRRAQQVSAAELAALEKEADDAAP
jgi:hypothetical protein